MYCLQRGARRSGYEQACELTIVIWAAALCFRQTLLTLKSKQSNFVFSFIPLNIGLSWFNSKAILQRTFFLPSWYDDFCGWCCAAVILLGVDPNKESISRVPTSEVGYCWFCTFDLDLLMNHVIEGGYLFLSSQPLRELNASSERALLVPDHPTKERTLVRRSWMKINFAPRSAFIN